MWGGRQEVKEDTTPKSMHVYVSVTKHPRFDHLYNRCVQDTNLLPLTLPEGVMKYANRIVLSRISSCISAATKHAARRNKNQSQTSCCGLSAI